MGFQKRCAHIESEYKKNAVTPTCESYRVILTELYGNSWFSVRFGRNTKVKKCPVLQNILLFQRVLFTHLCGKEVKFFLKSCIFKDPVKSAHNATILGFFLPSSVKPSPNPDRVSLSPKFIIFFMIFNNHLLFQGFV